MRSKRIALRDVTNKVELCHPQEVKNYIQEPSLSFDQFRLEAYQIHIPGFNQNGHNEAIKRLIDIADELFHLHFREAFKPDNVKNKENMMVALKALCSSSKDVQRTLVNTVHKRKGFSAEYVQVVSAWWKSTLSSDGPKQVVVRFGENSIRLFEPDEDEWKTETVLDFHLLKKCERVLSLRSRAIVKV